MATTYFEGWETNPGNKIIQNTDYLTSQYVKTCAIALAGNYLDWGQGVNGFDSVNFVNKNLRVPIKFGKAKNMGGILLNTSDSTFTQRIFQFGTTRYSIQSSSTSDTLLDYMPRVYAVLKPLGEYLDNLNTADLPFVWTWCNGNYTIADSDPRGWIFNRQDYTTFRQTIDDMYILDSISFYTNKNDGTVQDLIGTITNDGKAAMDIFIPLAVTKYSYSAIAFYGYYEHLFNSGYSNGNATPKIMAGMFNDTGLQTRLITGAGYYLRKGQSEGDTVYYYGSGDNYFTTIPVAPRVTVAYATKAFWQELLNGGGCAWSYDLDKVTAPDDSGLHKPTTPGQPPNPVDDSDGTGDNISDTITYPAVSYVPSGYTKYWITPSQLPDLKQFLFSQTFFDNIQRLWQNPGEYIVDCTYYPINPYLLDLMSVQEDIPIGNILSGVQGYLYPDTAKPYHFAGSVKLEPYYNSYLDYAPYTSVDIYIPYIGIRPLDVSRITGHKLLLAYSFDFSSRQITAHLGLDGDMTAADGSLGNALDSFTGAFGISFPFSGTQNNAVALNVLQQTTGAISSLGAMVGGVATGNIAAIAGGAIGAVNTLQHGNLSPEVYGNLTPTAGLYAPQQPYLIINRPITAEPADFKNKQGYASCYSGAVSEFSGFLQCAAVDMQPAGTMTVAEQSEIEQLLLGGIYCG